MKYLILLFLSLNASAEDYCIPWPYAGVTYSLDNVVLGRPKDCYSIYIDGVRHDPSHLKFNSATKKLELDQAKYQAWKADNDAKIHDRTVKQDRKKALTDKLNSDSLSLEELNELMKLRMQ